MTPRLWIEEARASARRRLPERAIEFVQEVRNDRISAVAAEVAFFSILSMVPWLIMLVAAIGSLDALFGVDVADDVKSVVIEWLGRILTDKASGTLDAVRALFEEDRQGLLTIGAVLALWSSSRGFAAVIAALNVAYDIEETRSWIARRGRALLLAVGSIIAGALLLLAFVAPPVLARLGFFGAGETLATGWSLLRWPAAAVGLVAWSGFLYRFGPNRWVAWRETLPGAVLAAAAWIAASAAFHTYLSLAGSANPIFGVLGGSLILLVWLYLLALGLLAGGELNAVIARSREP